MGKRAATTRLRRLVAVAGTALLIPPGVSSTASAAPADPGDGHRAIELGAPEPLRTVTKADATAAGDLDCRPGESVVTRTQSCSYYWREGVIPTMRYSRPLALF